MRDHFLGQPGSDMSCGPEQKTALLGCACGEVGCWPLMAKVAVEGNEVVWRDFEQPHRGGVWTYEGLGPFRFGRSEQEAALDELVSHADRTDETGLPIAQVAADLEVEFGQALVAVMAGVSDRKTVGGWARGERRPRREAEERLRCAYQVWQILRADEDAETTRLWFVGMNPDLDDEAPARAIARGDFSGAIVAARSFGRL